MILGDGTLIIAAVFRTILVCYGLIHDALYELKYTDVDYFVYSDAANFVVEGKSPYERDTYRYSPLIAWLLVPNIIHPLWGKVLFCSMDLVAACLIKNYIDQEHPEGKERTAVAQCLWLFNPFTFTISTRGNCDSLTAVSLLALLSMLRSRKLFFSGILWAICVHWRLFPVIYGPVLLLFLLDLAYDKGPQKRWLNCLLSLEIVSFGAGFVLTFGALAIWFYSLYGLPYVENSFLYHFTRSDPRHNFSIHFYPTYLLTWKSSEVDSSWFEFIDPGKFTFIIQSFLITLFAFRFRKDLPLCFLLTTIAFVTFNKVCTAQYFVWYFCLLPLLTPRKSFQESLPLKRSIIQWMVGQCVWLLCAYLLEFQGFDAYLVVWLASCNFLLSHTDLIVKLIRTYQQ